MNTKHTPGPWTVKESRTYPERRYVHEIAADGSDVTVTTLCGAPADDREAAEGQAADAHLIAAAPDLLAALKSTTLMLSYEATSHEESGDPKRRTYVESIRAQVALAREAIAKAEGSK